MFRLKSKVLALFITALVMFALILSGPAEAFLVKFSLTDSIIKIGQIETIIATAEVEEGELLDIQHFIIYISGPSNQVYSCSFYPNGSVVNYCRGFTINAVELAPNSYGYGYGYGYNLGYTKGLFKYNISFDTSTLLTRGTYTVKFIAVLPDRYKQTQTQRLIVESKSLEIESCSVRAKGGVYNLTSELNPKSALLNFHVPKKNAAKGQGFLLIREKKNYFNYDFKILETKKIDTETYEFKVLGIVKQDKRPKIPLNSTIIYHRMSDTVDIYSNRINMTNMSVSFSKC